MNNENKYQFINNLPKEYHHILWDIMIKAECNHSVDRPKGLSKQECKLIMRFLYKLFNNIKEIQQENKQLKDLIDTILNFSFFKEECPLNLGFENNTNEDKSQSIFYEDQWCENNCDDNYKDCWLKYFKKLQKYKSIIGDKE